MKKVVCPKCGKPAEKNPPITLKNGKTLTTYIHSETREMGMRLIGEHCNVIEPQKAGE